MYDQTFSRRTPGCIVVLLDRSESMKLPWGSSGFTLAQGAARALNNILLELCIKATKEPGAGPRHYFDFAVYGYGVRPKAGGEGVESAFGGALTGRDFVPLPELHGNPLAIREEPSIDAASITSKVPVWVEPESNYRTPMCQAIATAGAQVYEWANQHQDSFPPIVLNITDGIVTDSPYDGADLREWAQRLTRIATTDGSVLLFNIFLSPDSAEPRMFPSTPHGLPAPGPELFEISSPLPATMIDNARANGIVVEPGARGLGFQANLEMLVRFLEIGTRIVDIQGPVRSVL
jgi:hypothetical protein